MIVSSNWCALHSLISTQSCLALRLPSIQWAVLALVNQYFRVTSGKPSFILLSSVEYALLLSDHSKLELTSVLREILFLKGVIRAYVVLRGQVWRREGAVGCVSGTHKRGQQVRRMEELGLGGVFLLHK